MEEDIIKQADFIDNDWTKHVNNLVEDYCSSLKKMVNSARVDENATEKVFDLDFSFCLTELVCNGVCNDELAATISDFFHNQNVYKSLNVIDFLESNRCFTNSADIENDLASINVLIEIVVDSYNDLLLTKDKRDERVNKDIFSKLTRMISLLEMRTRYCGCLLDKDARRISSNSQFVDNLKSILAKNKTASLGDLEHVLNLSHGYFSRLINPASSTKFSPSLSFLQDLSTVLDVSFNSFFTNDNCGEDKSELSLQYYAKLAEKLLDDTENDHLNWNVCDSSFPIQFESIFVENNKNIDYSHVGDVQQFWAYLPDTSIRIYFCCYELTHKKWWKKQNSHNEFFIVPFEEQIPKEIYNSIRARAAIYLYNHEMIDFFFQTYSTLKSLVLSINRQYRRKGGRISVDGTTKAALDLYLNS